MSLKLVKESSRLRPRCLVPSGRGIRTGREPTGPRRISLQAAALRLVCLLATGASLFAAGGAQACPPQDPAAAGSKPKWHSIVITPRTNLPAIHFYNKLNPVWWFGNMDEPRAPDWYRPHARFRNVAWFFRNPFENFSNYVIGFADKKSVRIGWYPDQNSDPRGGWNFAISRRRIIVVPFIDYKRGRFEFYFGWREHGNFGIKLNFRQALPESNPPPPAVILDPCLCRPLVEK